MQLIILGPFLIAIVLLIFYPPERVFLYVYLPTLILLPQSFSFHVPRVPDMTFCQFAILPIAFATLLSRFYLWRFTFTDLLLLAFFLLCMYSEFINEGLGSWAAETTFMITNMLFPYLLAKMLIHPLRMSIHYAKACVVLAFTNILLTPYELRFMVNPYFQIFSKFFPGQGEEWPTITRYGLVRISGPFIQPIFHGIMLSTSWLLNYWLSLNHYWGPYRYIPIPRIPKSFLYGSVLFLGLLLTFSRGPLISCFIGFLFVGVGFSKRPIKTLLIRLSLFTITVLCLWQMYAFYKESTPSEDASDQERTLVYRTELLENYESIAMEQWQLGWGLDSWPKTSFGTSIDNHYLVLALNHGLFAVGLLVSIMLYVLIRVFLKGFVVPRKNIQERSLAFTLFGIYLMMCVAFITVYMGLQMTPLFYLLTGWIEGFISSRPRNSEEWAIDAQNKERGFKHA